MLQTGRSTNYTAKKNNVPNFVRHFLFANYFLANDEIDQNDHLAFGRI